MSLIIELQKMSIDSNCDILSLLRKSYLVSRKLEISDFQEWITHELNGYNTTDGIPDYRQITGTLKGFNPYRGWIPVIIPNHELEQTICTHKLHDSIPSLFTLINNLDNNHLSLQLPGTIIQNICSMTGHDANYELHISPNSISNVIEQVKNKILDWSLLLEETGILGNDLQFSDIEKDLVHNSPQIINYVSNFYGDIDHSNVQQGNTASTIN